MFSREMNVQRRKFDVHSTVKYRTFDKYGRIFGHFDRYEAGFSLDINSRGILSFLKEVHCVGIQKGHSRKGKRTVKTGVTPCNGNIRKYRLFLPVCRFVLISRLGIKFQERSNKAGKVIKFSIFCGSRFKYRDCFQVRNRKTENIFLQNRMRKVHDK